MVKPGKPSFRVAFLFWLKLGFISFGGPAGQIAIMHEFLVEKKRWISESRFLHALNYCMLLPGPEAQQMATYTGWLLHGVRGALVAGILFVLPSVFILLALSILYVLFGELPAVYSILNGLKPAVIAIVVLAFLKIGKKSMSGILHYIIAALSFVAIFFFNLSFPLIIISALIIGFIVQRARPQYLAAGEELGRNASMEEGFYINAATVLPDAGFSSSRLIKQIITGLLLWAFPFLLFMLFTNDAAFWNSIGLFFTKAALVTFGGAYAILPYVAQVSVQQFHWLNEFQMLDGLALGETTPGPLIMVLAFVGFMGGYNHSGASVLNGTAGLLVTVWFTFLPSILFVLVGAPVIERTQRNPSIRGLLSVVSAAVVGVILNLAVYLIRALLFQDGFTFSANNLFHASWIIISLIALHRFKINMIAWIGVSALAGLGYYLVFS
ncbi:MAG: chromate transporter [Bacteroidetes bacterium]|nr:chromate transporter [Bacteroidota bacterium]